jgi:hypothetical protein
VPQRGRGLGVRTARSTDAEAVAEFACSTGQWFEDEVEHQIRVDALRRAEAHGEEYRLLLFEEDGRLWAVGAHQPELLVMTSGDELGATRLVALAIAIEQQETSLPDGSGYSDWALAGLIRDALLHRGLRTLASIVARGNVRSQRLCRRHGLTSEIAAGPRHLRMMGSFELRQR